MPGSASVAEPGKRCFLILWNYMICTTPNFITMTRFWLPIIAVLSLVRKQVGHDRRNGSTMGDNVRVLFEYGGGSSFCTLY